MKRIIYFSRFARNLSNKDIDEIGNVASANNLIDDITGVLLCLNDHFYQVIEGEDEKIDQLYASIQRDSRHTNVTCLAAEVGVADRAFPDWSMKTINLDQNTDVLVQPVKVMLRSRHKKRQYVLQRCGEQLGNCGGENAVQLAADHVVDLAGTDAVG